MMPLEHYTTLAGLMAAFMAVPAGIVGYFLYGVRQDLSEVRTESARSIELIEERIREMEENKVDRRDWLRSEASAANRIDRVCTKIDKLSGKIDGAQWFAGKMRPGEVSE
jgi:hypothetical protein